MTSIKTRLARALFAIALTAIAAAHSAQAGAPHTSKFQQRLLQLGKPGHSASGNFSAGGPTIMMAYVRCCNDQGHCGKKHGINAMCTANLKRYECEVKDGEEECTHVPLGGDD